MSFPLETAVNGGRMDGSLVSDRIKEYVQRVQSRPAYVKGLEKGPDYKYGELTGLPIGLPQLIGHYQILARTQAPRTSCRITDSFCDKFSSQHAVYRISKYYTMMYHIKSIYRQLTVTRFP